MSSAYSLGGTPIEPATALKDIAVCLDSAFSFNPYVSFIVGRAMKTLGIIYRITQMLRHPTCVIGFFRALVRSWYEFALVVWNSLRRAQTLSIELVEKGMIRIV